MELNWNTIIEPYFEKRYGLKVPYKICSKKLSKNTAGVTDVENKVIYLNSSIYDYDELLETAFHESAHAITYELFGQTNHTKWFYKFYKAAMEELQWK